MKERGRSYAHQRSIATRYYVRLATSNPCHNGIPDPTPAPRNVTAKRTSKLFSRYPHCTQCPVASQHFNITIILIPTSARASTSLLTTQSSAMPQSFLLVALAWNNVKLLLGDGQEEREEKLIASVKTDLAEGEEKFREAGLEHEIIYYGSEEDMARLESKLAEREWTGVCM